MSKPGTIWITGLSVSGKTTLGERLFADLLKKGVSNVELFDGEKVRKKLRDKYGYLNKDRVSLSFHNAELAMESNKKGNIAIIAAIAHKKEIRKKIRDYLGNFMEVYLNCPVEVCAKRDYKGHYGKAFSGEYDNFVGVTEQYEKSDSVELILDTANQSIEECSAILLEASLGFIYERTMSEKFKK